MYQILSLRPDPKNTGKLVDYLHFKKFWRFPNIESLFQNIEKYIANIPESERYDLFFTINDCLEDKRKFLAREYHAIDIDGGPDLIRTGDYAKIIAEFFGVGADKMGIACSGNGLHFYIKLKEKITNKEFFKENKRFNDEINQKLNKKIEAAGLTGKCDDAVFDAARIMRLPLTENRKKGKAVTKTYIINKDFEPVDVDLVKLAGIPNVSESEQITGQYEVDSQAIMQKCAFLKEMINNPAWVHENHLYAAFSFVSRFDDSEAVGREIVHIIQKSGVSDTIKSYTDGDISKKLAQAEKASGPRTCSNMDEQWGRCRECPYYNKIKSPISLKSDNYIRTKKSGFWNMAWKESLGKYVSVEINYEDLAKYFSQLHGEYLAHAKTVYVYKENHYVAVEDKFIKSFALNNVVPMAKDYQRKEFNSFLEEKNIVTQTFWDNTVGKINFKNGVLDLKTMSLGPHSPKHGFQYCLDYDYDPKAKAPVFDKFLKEITCGDESAQTLLKEFIGYAISGDRCWAQKALILLGDGSNGKSTFMDLIKNIMGRHAHTALRLQSLKKPESLSTLNGSLFNICEESPQMLGDSAIIKALISGDEVEARRLYKDTYFFVNRAKFIFSCNNLPQNSDHAFGFYRRFTIIPFNQTFDDSNKDITISSKLEKELSGILNEVVAAYKGAVGRRGFSAVTASADLIEEYKTESDWVSDWVKNDVVFTNQNTFHTTQQLFERFKLYYDASHIGWDRESINIKTFGKRLKNANKNFAGRYKQTKIASGYYGISFINDHNTDF